jgi:hypothetical protein
MTAVNRALKGYKAWNVHIAAYDRQKNDTCTAFKRT